jgi:predicted nucleotidyltransferase
MKTVKFIMTQIYEKTITQLWEKLVEELQNTIECIVLYGSVAKGEAHEDSDIDILVVTRDDDRKLYDRISKIRTMIDLENNTLTTLVYMSKDEIEQYVKLGSPFIENVLKEGIILYDNGFFKKVCGSITLKG